LWRFGVLALAALVIALGLIVWAQLDPSDAEQMRWAPRCVFRDATGLLCPGCGAGRALHRLLHGEVWLAFRNNPYSVLFLPVAVIWAVMVGLGWAMGRRFAGPFIRARWIWVIFAAIMLFWILRNIPGPPFDLLRPVDPVSQPTTTAPLLPKAPG
jgi:hypothetical protein